MALSVLDIFKIGIGPSSSHTVGPMRAAAGFARELGEAGLLEAATSVRPGRYGSLGATGKGHASGDAVLPGLEGEQPETVDMASAPRRLAALRAARQVRLLGRRAIRLAEPKHLLHFRKALALHPNGMRFARGGLAVNVIGC